MSRNGVSRTLRDDDKRWDRDASSFVDLGSVMLADNQRPNVVVSGDAYVRAGSAVTVNEPSTARQIAPQTAALNDGGYVTIWTSTSTNPDLAGTYLRRFDDSGAAVGPEVRISASATIDAKVSGLSGGGFVIVWSDMDGGGTGVFSQRFDSAGGAQGPATLVHDQTMGNQTGPVVESFNDNGYIVSWTTIDADGVTQDLYVRRFDTGGIPQGAEIRLATSTASNFSFDARLIELSEGGYAVAWRGPQFRIQLFDAADTPQIPVIRYAPAGDDDFYDVEALADGSLVFAWSGSASAAGVSAQHFAADGTATGAAFRVDQADGIMPALQALDDGGFAVAWLGRDQPSTALAGFVRYFDPSGEPRTDQSKVTSAPTGNSVTDLALERLSTGALIATWSGAINFSGNRDIYLQRLDPSFDWYEGFVLDLRGAINVADADGDAEQLSVTLSSDYGILVVDSGTSGVTAIGGETGTIVLTGTFDQIRTLLSRDSDGLVGFRTNSSDPPSSARLTIVVDDGAASPALATAVVSITPTDDETLVGSNTSEDLVAPDGNGWTLYGRNGNDGLFGGGGEDRLIGGDGNDYLAGGGGNDAIDGGKGDDVVLADDGNDTVFGFDGNDSISGGDGGDYIESGEGDDAVRGEAGNDVINAWLGNDYLFGGDGDDRLEGVGGDDQIWGDAGNDELYGGSGNDGLFGGDGNDGLFAGAGNDYMDGGDGNDFILCDDTASAVKIALGGNGNDTILGRPLGGDFFYGGAGDDLIDGRGSDRDYIEGGEGNDQITGSGFLFGENGNDTITGLDGADDVSGGDGADYIRGGRGADQVYGDAGNDVMFGDQGNDGLFGGDGDDQLNGEGPDPLPSGAGNDYLDGGGGNDTLIGGRGLDILIGGDGQDAYRMSVNAGNDTIVGFETGVDRIELIDLNNLPDGPLDPNAFVVGTRALDADDRIIYDDRTGGLFYDSDGSGSFAAYQLATLAQAPTITAADFLVI